MSSKCSHVNVVAALLVFIHGCFHVCRALRARKKMGGENMPVQMIGDVLAAELSHMQPYIRFCSCQINGATLVQSRIDSEPNFKEFLKVAERGSRARHRLRL